MRRLPNNQLALITGIVLILMIGVITLVAWQVINRSVEDQFRASESQLATSLAQQTQASFNALASDLIALSSQPDILASGNTNAAQAAAFELLAAQANEQPAIRSIARFDHQSSLRYAWPATDFVDYRIPRELVVLTEGGQEVAAEIPTQVIEVQGTTFLLTAFDARSRNTEYLVFELDLERFFTDLFGFVDLGNSGQIWVLSDTQELLYQANDRSMSDQLEVADVAVNGEPIVQTYDDGERQAVVIAANALNSTYLLLLSRDADEAQTIVQGDLLLIFALSSASMLIVVVLGSTFLRRIAGEREQRVAAQERRESVRGLLEVSRGINSSLELNVVLERILAALEQIVPHDSASVLLIDQREHELYIAAQRGSNGNDIPQAIAAREVMMRDAPVLINNTTTDQRWDSLAGRHIASWIGLPLHVRSEMVGVLNIDSRTANHFSEEDIELAMAFADQASVAIQNASLHEVRVKQIEQELRIARGIQESLLPTTAPDIPQLEIVSHTIPAQEVSGDYHQYFTMPNNRLCIAIGDVQGKGIPAALMTAVISTALRDETGRYTSPSEILGALNQRLLERMKRNNLNSALQTLIFDPYTRQITIANGGMIQPYVRLGRTGTFDFVSVGGYPLGISDKMNYRSTQLTFEVGSLMVMCSDGLIEAQDANGEFFGFERFEELLNGFPPYTTAQQAMDRILEAFRQHLGEAVPQDDTTLIVVRSLATEAPERPTQTTINLSLPSHLGFERIARRTVEALADVIEFPPEKIEDIKTVVAEACMNAIEHGNEADPSHNVNIQMTAIENRLEIRVRDSGQKTLSPEFPEPGKGDMRGWGLFFMQNLVDNLEVNQLPHGGNEVFMVIENNGTI